MSENPGKPAIFFFAPKSYHLQSRQPQAKAAYLFKKHGYPVSWFIDDARLLRRDQSLPADVLRESDALDGRICSELSLKAIRSSELDHLKYRESAEALFASIGDVKQLEDFELENIKIGRAVIAEVVFEQHYHNKSQIDLTSAFVRNKFFECASAVLVSDRLVKDFPIDLVTSYNSGYASHRCFCWSMSQKGSRYFSLDAGINYANFFDSMRFFEGSDYDEALAMFKDWTSFREKVPKSSSILKGAAHLVNVMNRSSSHCFSESPSQLSSSEIRKYCGAKPGQRIILAATSSIDEKERASALTQQYAWNSVFADQAEWLGRLVDFAAKHKNYAVIVRIHPREFGANRASSGAASLLSILESRPDNVTVNTPSDSLSIYDIAKEVSLILPYITSAACDFMQMGIPGVRFCSATSYPDDHGFLAKTEAEYFEAIERLSQADYTIEDMVQIYRWVAYSKVTTRMDVDSRSWQLGGLGSERKSWIPEKIRRIFGSGKEELSRDPVAQIKEAQPEDCSISDIIKLGNIWNTSAQLGLHYGGSKDKEVEAILLCVRKFTELIYDLPYSDVMKRFPSDLYVKKVTAIMNSKAGQR